MSIKVTVWKAKDGKIFDSKIEADHYEILAKLFNYISDHPIYGFTDGCKIDGETFGRWLKENPRIYIQLLADEENKNVTGS